MNYKRKLKWLIKKHRELDEKCAEAEWSLYFIGLKLKQLDDYQGPLRTKLMVLEIKKELRKAD